MCGPVPFSVARVARQSVQWQRAAEGAVQPADSVAAAPSDRDHWRPAESVRRRWPGPSRRGAPRLQRGHRPLDADRERVARAALPDPARGHPEDPMPVPVPGPVPVPV